MALILNRQKDLGSNFGRDTFAGSMVSKGLAPTTGEASMFNAPTPEPPSFSDGQGNNLNDFPVMQDQSLSVMPAPAQGQSQAQSQFQQPAAERAMLGSGFATDLGVFNKPTQPGQTDSSGRRTTNPNATPVGGELRRAYRDFVRQETGRPARIDARPTLSAQSNTYFQRNDDGSRSVNYSRLDNIKKNNRNA
jgi:hypothetical protein